MKKRAKELIWSFTEKCEEILNRKKIIHSEAKKIIEEAYHHLQRVQENGGKTQRESKERKMKRAI